MREEGVEEDESENGEENGTNEWIGLEKRENESIDVT